MKAFIVLSQIYEDPPASPAALTPSLHRDVHGSADMGLPCAQTPPLGPLNPPPPWLQHLSSVCLVLKAS